MNKKIIILFSIIAVVLLVAVFVYMETMEKNPDEYNDASNEESYDEDYYEEEDVYVLRDGTEVTSGDIFITIKDYDGNEIDHVEMTTEQLYNEYYNNGPAAKEKYRYSDVVGYGVVTEISESIRGIYAVVDDNIFVVLGPALTNESKEWIYEISVGDFVEYSGSIDLNYMELDGMMTGEGMINIGDGWLPKYWPSE